MTERITIRDAERDSDSGRLVDKHLPRIMMAHPEAFLPEEEGSVMPQESVPEKSHKKRADNDVIGNEVVRQSSKKPVVLRPNLEATRKELAQSRADTHTRVEHEVSNLIAHGTGFVSGLVDGLSNGVAEIGEDVAFGISKTTYGIKHGWERGKSQVKDN